MTYEDRDVVTSIEVRQLRKAVYDLAEMVEDLAEEHSQRAVGQGPPKHARRAKEKAQRIREATPPPVRDEDSIQPPWEREGYDSKQAWLDDRE